MEPNTSSSSSSSSVSDNVENKPTSLISAIAGSLSDAVHGVIQSAASTIQQGLQITSSSQSDDDVSSSSSSPSLDDKVEQVKEQSKEIVSSASEKVEDVVDAVKSSASSAVDKTAALLTTAVTEGEDNNTNSSSNNDNKEEGKTMSYSEYALEQFSRGGCNDKKLTMEMVAHIQRIADRTNDTVLHDMARKAHSAFAKGFHDAPGVHLTWITVEQANELVNLAIRTQDRALADYARYCQSVAATTQLGVEPFPGKISQELSKGRADLASLGRSHSGPGYGAAFSTIPRPQHQQQGMTKSTSGTSIASLNPSLTSPTSLSTPSSAPFASSTTAPTMSKLTRSLPASLPSSISPSPSLQQIKPVLSSGNNTNERGMMKSYSTTNAARSERYGFGPSPLIIPSSSSPTSSNNSSPTSVTTPTRASFGTAPNGYIPKVYGAPTAPVVQQPHQQQPKLHQSQRLDSQQQQQLQQPKLQQSQRFDAQQPQKQPLSMQKSASSYHVPPSKAAAIASGYVPLSQRTPGMMMMGMMTKSASTSMPSLNPPPTSPTSSSSPSSVSFASSVEKDKAVSNNNNGNANSGVDQPVVKKSMVKSFSTNTAAMPSVSTPIATDLKLTMDMVAHLQRIADRTGDVILHSTARKAHSACAKGLHEAPGVHLTKITPEQANELVNLAIRTQDHGLADFARYCQSVAATTQLGIEPSPGKIGQELAKGRLELAQQGRSYTGPGYGAAFASLNKSLSGRDVSLLKSASSPKDSPSSSSPSSPSTSSIPSSDPLVLLSTHTIDGTGGVLSSSTHDAQGQIKEEAVKAAPFVPSFVSEPLAQ